MQTYRLRGVGAAVDLRLIALLRQGRQAGVVSEGGHVRLAHASMEPLRFLDAVHPVPGTPLLVWLAGDCYCAVTADLLAQEQAEQHAQRQAALAAAANARLHLPVPWDTQIRPVRSGLLMNSWGDGTNRATVIHIQVQAPLTEGRLHREAGWLLCCQRARDNGAYADVPGGPARYAGPDGEYQPAVTCKACLRLARRWEART